TNAYQLGARGLGEDDLIAKPGVSTLDNIVDAGIPEGTAQTQSATPPAKNPYADDPDDLVEDEIEYTISHGIPIEINDKVEEWITYFSVKDHDRFQRFLDKGEVYREMIDAILGDQGVPHDLYYLAMIESG